MKRFSLFIFILIYLPFIFGQQTKPWPWHEFPSINADNTLFIGTPNGLYKYQYEEDTWLILGTPQGFPSNHIQMLMWDGEWLWVGTPKGVAAGDIRLNKWLVYSDQNGLPSAHILCIASEEDYVWVGTDRGAARYDKIIQEWEQFTISSGLPDSIIYDIVVDGEFVYFATGHGLAEYNLRFEKWRYYGKDNGIPSDTIRFIYPTKEYLWLFTDQGPAQFNKKLHTTLSYCDPRLRFSAIRDMALENEQMWLGTESGIYIYDLTTAMWREFPERTNLPDSSIKALVFTQNNKWFITEKGISVFNKKDKSWRKLDKAQGLSSEQYDAVATFRDRIFLINQEVIDHYRFDENRWYVYSFEKERLISKSSPWISLDRERGSSIRFGKNFYMHLGGTRFTYRLRSSGEYPATGGGSLSSNDVSRVDLKTQLNLPKGQTVNAFYDNTDFSQTLYGVKYRGKDSDVLQEIAWGDIRVEQGKNEILPNLGIFGSSARLEVGEKTERYKRSLFSARGFTGERTVAQETEFFSGNLKSSESTFPDTAYIRHSIFRIGPPDEPFPIDKNSEQIFMDDNNPRTNTANTIQNMTIAGIVGDFDQLYPLIHYRLDPNRGIVQFMMGISPNALIVVKGTSRGIPFEHILKTPGHWENTLVNRYFVGGMEILPHSFRLNIFDVQGHFHPLLEFGLDQDGDGRVDPEFINYKEGILTFPQERPFPSSVYDSIPAISHYYMKTQFQSEIPSFSLFHSNLLRGTERVLVDGELLVPGNDYILDYTVGTLLFLKEGVITEDSEIQVDYEYYRNTKEKFHMMGLGFSPSDNAYMELNAFGFDEEKPDGSFDGTQGLDFFGEFRGQIKNIDFKFTPQMASNRSNTQQGHHVYFRTEASTQKIRLFSVYEKIDPYYKQLFKRKFQLGELEERNTVGATIYPLNYIDISAGWLKQQSMPQNGLSSTEEECTGKILLNKPLYPAVSFFVRRRIHDTPSFNSEKTTFKGDVEYRIPESILRKLTFQSLHFVGIWRQSLEAIKWYPFAQQEGAPQKRYDTKYLRVDFVPADQIQMNAYYRKNRNETGNSFSLFAYSPYNPYTQSQKIFLTTTIDRLSGVNFYLLYQGEFSQFYPFPSKINHDQSLRRILLSSIRIYPGRWIPFLSPFTFEMNFQPEFNGFMRNVTQAFSLAKQFWEFPTTNALSYLDRNKTIIFKNEWRPSSLVTFYFDYEMARGLSQNWGSELKTSRNRLYHKTEFRPSIDMFLTFQYQYIQDKKENYSIFTTENPILWVEKRWSDHFHTKWNMSVFREIRKIGNISENQLNFSPLLSMTYRLNPSGYRLEIRDDVSASFFRSHKPSYRLEYHNYSNTLGVDYFPSSVVILQLKGTASYRNQLYSEYDFWALVFEFKLTLQL